RAVLPGDEAPDPIILAGNVHGPVRSRRNPIGDSEAVALKDRGDDFGERVRFALAAGPQIQRVAQRIVGVMRAQAPPAPPLRARDPTRGCDHATLPLGPFDASLLRYERRGAAVGAPALRGRVDQIVD